MVVDPDAERPPVLPYRVPGRPPRRAWAVLVAWVALAFFAVPLFAAVLVIAFAGAREGVPIAGWMALFMWPWALLAAAVAVGRGAFERSALAVGVGGAVLLLFVLFLAWGSAMSRLAH